LGYDWKIGIAIISSFAARSFVGTLATIYSVGGSDNVTIKNKMAAVNQLEKIFNFASGISLLLFYAFAMQCASTLSGNQRNQFLEVACGTIDLHVRLCLLFISNAQIGNSTPCN
jgi:Fe2+ transport system protein B